MAADAAALELDLAAVEAGTAAVIRKGRRVLRYTPPRPATAAAWRERVLAWLDEGPYDMLLSPAVDTLPPDAHHQRNRSPVLALPYTQAWNLAGLPAVVAPVLIRGRPAGVQLVGRPGSEAALLRAAARLERQAVPVAAR